MNCKKAARESPPTFPDHLGAMREASRDGLLNQPVFS
jgi:hypothetical protein